MLENFDELAAIFGGERPPFPRNSFRGPREEGFFRTFFSADNGVELIVDIFIIHVCGDSMVNFINI